MKELLVDYILPMAPAKLLNLDSILYMHFDECSILMEHFLYIFFIRLYEIVVVLPYNLPATPALE